MFERKIKFLAPSILMDDKKLHPEPTNKFLPEWFKELPLSYSSIGKKNHLHKTIKSCMPFLDAIKTGYVIKASTDIYFNHNFDNPDINNEKDTHIITKTQDYQLVLASKRLNINTGGEGHDPEQLGGNKCPFVHDNKGKRFFKILNPWVVKTPPGYSTLFIQHFNNPDKRFTPIAGIVDTDVFNLPVNFPIIMHQEGEWLIKKYEPVICVFPFKRDDWKHEIKSLSMEEIDKENFTYFTHFHSYYKNLIWKVKKWI